MRVFFIVLLLSVLVGCNNLFLPTNTQSNVIYQENTDNQKIFSFGNVNSRNNVLVIIGSDIYNSRILNIGNQSTENKILDYIVNPSLVYYYPEDPYSDVYNSKFNGLPYTNWKNSLLNFDNAYYYVIVTNKEECIFDLVKSSGLVFNYFMMYFHGNRNYISARALTRNDMVINFDDLSIRNNFSNNCISLMISCNLDNFNISGYSFATLLSYYIGVNNMIVSSSNVFDNMSSSMRTYYGDFRKVSAGWYNIEKAYMDYKAFVREKSYNSYKQKHIVVNFPDRIVVNHNTSVDLPDFYLVYSSCDNYYLNQEITNSYCDVYLNYKTRESIVRYISKNGDNIVSSISYRLSSEYFDLISFLVDVYGVNSIDYKYIDFVFL